MLRYYVLCVIRIGIINEVNVFIYMAFIASHEFFGCDLHRFRSVFARWIIDLRKQDSAYKSSRLWVAYDIAGNTAQ